MGAFSIKIKIQDPVGVVVHGVSVIIRAERINGADYNFHGINGVEHNKLRCKQQGTIYSCTNYVRAHIYVRYNGTPYIYAQPMSRHIYTLGITGHHIFMHNLCRGIYILLM